MVNYHRQNRYTAIYPSGNIAGYVNYHEFEDGWRFNPMNAAHKPSRKAWKTADGAVPAWAKRRGVKLV